MPGPQTLLGATVPPHEAEARTPRLTRKDGRTLFASRDNVRLQLANMMIAQPLLSVLRQSAHNAPHLISTCESRRLQSGNGQVGVEKLLAERDGILKRGYRSASCSAGRKVSGSLFTVSQ